MKSSVQLETEALDQLEEVIQRVETLELQLQQVFERNKRVEAEKAWETGALRIALIAALTYLATASVFFLIGVEHFLLNALIPTTGYLLSTASLSYLRQRRERRRQERQGPTPLRVM